MAAVLALLVGCSAPAGRAAPEPVRPAPKPEDPRADGWRAILRDAVEGVSVAEQQVAAESHQFMLQGKAWIDAGDFEKGRESLKEAVRRWPRNLEARAMLAEVNGLVDGDRWDGDALRRSQVQIEQAIVEIGAHVAKGRRLYEGRDFAGAAREFEEADFKIKHMPYEVAALREIQPRVDEMLRRARASR